MVHASRAAGAAFLLFVPAPALGLTLSLLSTSAPHPGITLERYRTSNPGANVWVARVDLCADGVSIEATGAPSALTTVASFGSSAGLQMAVNGDFYRVGPVRVYGRAVGEGVPWPDSQTGVAPQYATEWYYENFGWIAVGHDRVDLTHTEWVKNNLAPSTGWAPGTPGAAPPQGTLALVSGFPELVVDGQARTCPNPTDGCFPDRGDMQARHPRTAMGLTQDRATLLFVVVDGRTAESSGMYGSELADLMGQLGAFSAFNLDGGGSSQMWIEGLGTVNAASGNNGGNGLRPVANHWGVRATGTGRPSHCPTAPPCDVIPPSGKIIDEEGACFGAFGPEQFWREESAGHDGHLFWTNAWTTDLPSNWAWWQLHFDEAGAYEVEFFAEPAYSVFDAARYVVVAGGAPTEVIVDQGAASGWTSLGVFDFAAGGDQFVAVYDDASGPVAGDQHIVADALRVTRADPWCGDGTCDPGEDCATCASDCPPVDEIPDNGEDDDCDGTIDESDAPDASTLDVSGSADAGDTGGGEADGGRVDGGTGGADASEVEDSGGPPAVEPAGGCACTSSRSERRGLATLLPLLAFALILRRRCRPAQRDDFRRLTPR